MERELKSYQIKVWLGIKDGDVFKPVGQLWKTIEKNYTTEAGLYAKMYDLQNELELTLPGVDWEIEVTEVKWKTMKRKGDAR